MFRFRTVSPHFRSALRALTPSFQVIFFPSSYPRPAFEGIYGTIDKAFGHYRRYDKESAARMFRGSGFQVVACSYWNMLGFFGWWLNDCILHQREIHRPSALAFDKFIMPLVRLIEPVLWRPFGQSLLIVAKKIQ